MTTLRILIAMDLVRILMMVGTGMLHAKRLKFKLIEGATLEV